MKKEKVIALSPEMMAMFEQLRQEFIHKFGREPGPEDPIFFDPDADEPRPYPEERYNRDMVAALTASGAHPALIWAFLRTGLLVTEQNLPLLDADDLADWIAALNEYDAAERGRRQ